jgi:hypothetical protein
MEQRGYVAIHIEENSQSEFWFENRTTCYAEWLELAIKRSPSVLFLNEKSISVGLKIV